MAGSHCGSLPLACVMIPPIDPGVTRQISGRAGQSGYPCERYGKLSRGFTVCLSQSAGPRQGSQRHGQGIGDPASPLFARPGR
jgi:hypothetical protein